jgi:hypothetical protein
MEIGIPKKYADVEYGVHGIYSAYGLSGRQPIELAADSHCIRNEKIRDNSFSDVVNGPIDTLPGSGL